MTPAFLAGVGPLELLLVLLIVLVVVGGSRLPQLGRQLGGGLRGFKDSVSRKTGDQYRAARAELNRSEPEPEGEGEPVDGEIVREQR
jgi:sec-independent protein translocase protein TatA